MYLLVNSVLTTPLEKASVNMIWLLYDTVLFLFFKLTVCNKEKKISNEFSSHYECSLVLYAKIDLYLHSPALQQQLVSNLGMNLGLWKLIGFPITAKHFIKFDFICIDLILKRTKMINISINTWLRKIRQLQKNKFKKFTVSWRYSFLNVNY